jgi:hypothetical protein
MWKITDKKARYSLSKNTQIPFVYKKAPEFRGRIFNPILRLFTPGVQQAGGMSERAVYQLLKRKPRV